MRFDRVIWDFNGTILDDVEVGIEAIDTLLERYGLPPLRTRSRYYEVFGFPIIDYYRRVGFDFEKTDFTVLANEWVALYLEKVGKAPLREGIRDAILSICALGVSQTVLSMTEQSMLERQLTQLGIASAFDEICGLEDIYAESKLGLAGAWRGAHPDERVLYVGDTTHDAESAAVIGAECLLLTGGHERFEAPLHASSVILHSPLEVLRYL